MRKTIFFRYVLFAVLTFVFSASFVACGEDYDDDIKNLQEQIDAQKTLNDKITVINTTLDQLKAKDTDLQALINSTATSEAAKAAATAKAEAIKAAADALAAVKTALEGELATLNTKVAAIESTYAKKTDVEAAKKELNDKMDAKFLIVETEVAKISGILSTIGGLEGSVTTLSTAVTKLEADLAKAIQDIAANKAAIEEQKEALEAYKTSNDAAQKMTKEELEAAIAAANEKLEAAKADLEAKLAACVTKEDLVGFLTAADLADYVTQDELAAKIQEIKDLIPSAVSLDGYVTKEALETALNAATAGLQEAFDKYTAKYNDTYFDKLNADIAKISGDLAAFITTANSMITSVSLVTDMTNYMTTLGTGINFNTTIAIVDYTFNTDITGAITFVKDASVENPVSEILIRVSPANAKLTVDQISLINSKAGTDINSFVKVAEVKPFEQLLTRGLPTATGLWTVRFELASDDLEGLKEFTNVEAKKILYAIAVENTVDKKEAAEERHVMSSYDLVVNAGPSASIHQLDFTVDGINVINLKNRYLNSVNAPFYEDKKWNVPGTNNFTDPTKNTVADAADNRTSKDYLFTQVNKEVVIKLTNPAAYAYYAVLDKQGIGGGLDNEISERNAWNGYKYEGLNTIVKNGQDLVIKVTSSEADGDEIGIRVYAVNADGTLLDPDGKAFYLVCGEYKTNQMDFKIEFTSKFGGGLQVTDVVAFNNTTGIDLTKVVAYDLDIEVESGVHVINGNLGYWSDKNATTPANHTNFKFARLYDISIANLKDNKAYEGTLTLKNNINMPIGIIKVTLTKVIPTAFPANFDFKTQQYVGDVLKVYPHLVGGVGQFEMINSFNNLTGTIGFALAKDYGTDPVPAYSGIGAASLVTIAATDFSIIRSTAPKFSTKAVMDYGNIHFDPAKNPVLVEWSKNPFNIQFRSYMEDATYANAADLVIKYRADDKIKLNTITVTPVYGGTFANLKKAGGNGSDGYVRYSAVDAKLLTGNDIVNEYFDVTVDANDDIILTAKSNVSPPVTDVDTKLVLIITDEFGYKFEKTVTYKSFKMKLN